ncbi:MAG: hypothetical protein RIS99_818 [Bacteroidota bacterium]
MILKSLEIKGFKSFGDKVQINFDQGVTGIVGPNGCGKSNVVDSIRWVLGEQKTRALRSDKMENVIFNGTKNRKAAHLSEVSLQFENNRGILPTEYNEVKITRKLYRTGESEYQINGVNCRLKDIHSLFLDTGIGSDSYAIMELGMIDDILNDKENSRRQLFEEASGVSKYKIRKKETLQKLKGTDEDLSRVDDLLFEIEKNMKQLQSQAKKTERYYALRDEYKKLALEFAAHQLKQFSQELSEIHLLVQKNTDEIREKEAKISLEEANVEKWKLEIVHREKLLQSRQKATHEKLDLIRQYENEKNLQNQKLSMLSEQEKNLQNRLEEDKGFLEKVQQDLLLLEVDRQSAKEKVDELQEMVKASRENWKNSEAQLQETRKKGNQLQSDIQSVTQQKHQREKSMAVNKIQKDSLLQEIERNYTEKEEKDHEFSGFEEELQRLTQETEGLENDLQSLRKEEEGLVQNLEFLNKHLTATQHEKQLAERSLDAKRNEFQLTKSLVDNLEGYPESLKFLKKNAIWATHAQLLSDLITCDPELKTSIENFLEPYLNYYVVDSMEEAFQGVSLLSDSAKGRANFFVIEYFHAHAQHKPILAPQTVSALTKVNVDAKYNHLINYLLGNVYVLQAADAQQEAQLASEYRKKYPSAVFLSSSGKYIITGQSVGGGSIGLFEGKRLGRKRNLEILTKEMSELEDKIQDFETALQKNNQEINSIKALTKQPLIQEKQQVLQTISAQLQVIQSRQNQHIQFIEKHQNRNDAIQSKMEECERLILQDGPILEQLEKNLGALQTESQSIQEQITLAIETNQTLSQEFNQWNTEFLQWQSKFSVLERDHNFNQNQQTVLENRMEKNTLQLDETKKQLSEILQTPELNDVVLVDMYKEKESMDAAVSEADLAVAEAKNKGLELDQNIRQYRKEKEEIQSVLSELKNSENEILLKKSAVSERLSVEFKIPSEELEELKPTVSIDLIDLKMKVESHKQRLDQFGEINPLALEAFQEISQRFDFISSQKNDLLDSKKILTDTLKEIDKTAKEKFQYAFDLIRSNFQKVFRTLFTEEDTCDLMLLHPDDPLDSPINILARPKGKKPLTINQLSGGEKTLTAIALLFAIYLYKPAPFCIFDEVDAPLDDVNIDKFNRIIREFSAQSQFIIVTHNKRTMETTDVMYGITMVEQGVSRVVPVDLKAVAN